MFQNCFCLFGEPIFFVTDRGSYEGSRDLGLSLRSTGAWGDTMKSYHQQLNGLDTSRDVNEQFQTPRRIVSTIGWSVTNFKDVHVIISATW